MGCLRAGRQHVQDFFAFVFAFGLDTFSENKFRSGFMLARIVEKAAAIVGLVDRPSGENFRDFRYIALRISAIHAERVEFEQFPAVVLIEAAVLLAALIPIGRETSRSSVGTVHRARRNALR